MQCYTDPNLRAGPGNSVIVRDYWEAYRGKYPDPTLMERYLINYFLVRFAFEDEDFVEDQHQHWTQLKDRLRCPNLRCLLITFLRQLRRTKGYDVDDLHLDFSSFGVHHKWSLFVPRRLDEKKCFEEAMAASKFAIGKINAQLRRSYEVVSVEKLVCTTPDEYNQITSASIMLLSFTAKAADVVESFQAMLYPKLIRGDSTLHLQEWKFKP